MRRHVHGILKYPGDTGIYVDGFGQYRDTLNKKSQNWDNDNWSFGQVLTIGLWFPAFLEFVYVLISKLYLLISAKDQITDDVS
jgi:hypothetical protein